MSRMKSPFAFLGRSAAASDDDDKDDKNKSKSKSEEKDDDEDDKKDKDKKDDDAKGKSKSKAENDDEDDKDDDKKKKKDDDEDDDKAKSKKDAKGKAEDDDDTSASVKAARARERGRIRAILVSEAGQADPVAAAHIALDTDMPRDQAIGMLAAMSVSRAALGGSAPSRAGLGDRMSDIPNPTVGADGGSSAGPTMAERIIAAGKKARGEA